MDADDPSSATASSSGDTFFDALDSLPSPSPSPSLSPSPSPPPSPSAPPPHTPSSSTLRRRPRRAKSLKQPDSVLSPSPSASAATSTVTAVEDEPLKPDSSEATSAAPRTVPASEVEEEEEEEEHNKATGADADVEVEARASTPTPTPAPSILEYLAVLVIKAVVFLVSALISCLAFPVRLLQWWFLFVTDPLGLARRARAWVLGVAGDAAGTLIARLGGEGVGKVAQRIVWGSLWAAYVCVVLCALLIMAFVGGGLLVGRIVEEPVQVTETLNFDYTKPSPMAFVPVPRLVPLNQRMQLEVSLTLPESDYNRRLGVFQVKAEFLSADGKVISTSSQPCMLKFKSVHMHFIETFLQSVSLLSGYSLEYQVIRLKMRGITQGLEPTTAVRIILEQRAELGRGAGIPEIYAASLKLEAELPLFKRLLWNWRWTLFVWSSMGFFVFELLFALMCCRPCIFPRSGHNVAAL